MNINSISWHKTNLENRGANLSRKMEELNRMHNELQIMGADYDFYKYQIECAEKEGKESFNADRYKVKRDKSI